MVSGRREMYFELRNSIMISGSTGDVTVVLTLPLKMYCGGAKLG